LLRDSTAMRWHPAVGATSTIERENPQTAFGCGAAAFQN